MDNFFLILFIIGIQLFVHFLLNIPKKISQNKKAKSRYPKKAEPIKINQIEKTPNSQDSKAKKDQNKTRSEPSSHKINRSQNRELIWTKNFTEIINYTHLFFNSSENSVVRDYLNQLDSKTKFIYGNYTRIDPLKEMVPVFTISSKFRNYDYFAVLNYYPTNKFRSLPEPFSSCRKELWNFKDGFSTEMWIELLISCIYYSPLVLDKNVIFCVIPASTKTKNIVRFQKISAEISSNFKWKNGFDAIKITEDRETLKGTSGVSKIFNLSYDQMKIQGKNVILFDDVKTKGKSFSENADKLIELGAKSVKGIFIGETYDLRKNGIPSWHQPEVEGLSFNPEDIDGMVRLPF